MIVTVHNQPDYNKTFESNWETIQNKTPETYERLFNQATEVWDELASEEESHIEFKIAIWNAIPLLARYKIKEVVGDSDATTGYILSNNHLLRFYYNQHLFYRELHWYKNADLDIFSDDKTANTPEVYDSGQIWISNLICCGWMETSQIVSMESFLQFLHNEPLSNRDLMTFNIMIEFLYNLVNQVKEKHQQGNIHLVSAVQIVLRGLYKYLKTGGAPLDHGSRTAIYHRFPRQLLTPLVILLLKTATLRNTPAITNIGIHINNPQKLFLFV